MKRRRIHVWALPSMQRTKALILISICCGMGIILGCFFALWTQDIGTDALSRYIESYLTLEPRDEWLGQVVKQGWNVLRLPLMVILLRFTVLGVLVIPLVVGMKGFLLSFAVSAFVRCYGVRGEAAAMMLFGASSAVEVGILLLLAVDSWVIARERGAGKERNGRNDRSVKGCVICVFLLCMDVGMQCAAAGWTGEMLRWVLNVC